MARYIDKEPLICPQCGGKINEAQLMCEYCGTKFKSEYDVIKVIAERPGIHTLTADVVIANEAIEMFGAEKASEIALYNIAGKMSRCIMPYISIRTNQDYSMYGDQNYTGVRGRLRVVDPKEWAR